MSQTEEGKWRVEFDEPWAKEGAKAPEAEAEANELSAADSKSKRTAPVDERSAA
jgi:DNA topoisomerase-3